MYNSIINHGAAMQLHQMDPLNRTVEMSVDEACQLMTYLADAVRVAVGKKMSSYKDFNGLELTIKEQPVLGSLTIIVRA